MTGVERRHGPDCRCDGCDPPGPTQPRFPTREEAYEDALRAIAYEVGVALAGGHRLIAITAIDTELAALIAVGYVPRSPTPDRRRLTAQTPD